jgi:hypothetical protein
MNDYNPGSFGDLASTEGQRLWSFLNERDNIVRMETATFLGRPAVEPLDPGLRAAFGGNQIRDNKRFKQFVGHLARQVMERLGYVIDRQHVRIFDNDNVFTSATRYKKSKPSSAPTGLADGHHREASSTGAGADHGA